MLLPRDKRKKLKEKSRYITIDPSSGSDPENDDKSIRTILRQSTKKRKRLSRVMDSTDSSSSSSDNSGIDKEIAKDVEAAALARLN